MTKVIQRVLLLAVIGLILIAAPSFIGQQGYILISFGNYTFEGSVVAYLVALSVLILALYAVWLVIRYLIVFIILPSKGWNNRSEPTHANFFQSGLDFMATAQWQQAAEQFLKVKRLSRIQTAQQLALVCAVRAQNSELLERVQKRVEPSDADALTKLIVLCQQQNYAQAMASLKALDVNLLKQDLAFQQIWLQVQLHNFNWVEVKKHLPKINKQVAKVTSSGENAVLVAWNEQLTEHFTQSFDNFVRKNSVNQLLNVWQELGKSVQHLAPVSRAYIQVLADQNQLQQIEQVLLQDEKLHGELWLLNNLRTCYHNMKRVHMDQLFIHIQKKMKKQQNAQHENKTLLAAYAYLAAGQKDNQLAKQALEQVIYTNQNKQDSMLYANVLAELGEIRHSLDVYQKLN